MTFYTHDLAQFLEQNRYLKKFWWLSEQSRGNILLCKSPSELEPSCPSSPSPMPIPSIAPLVLLILVQSYHRVSFSSLAQEYNLFLRLFLFLIFFFGCVCGAVGQATSNWKQMGQEWQSQITALVSKLKTLLTKPGTQWSLLCLL